VNRWNDEYCIKPLTLSISIPSKSDERNNSLCFHELDYPLALLEPNYLEFIGPALFGEFHMSFNEISTKLFGQLLNQLFQKSDGLIDEQASLENQWLYPGSTCLFLNLHCQQKQMTLILNPDWVYNELPAFKNKENQLSSLNEALSDQTVRFNVDLLPLNLTLKQVLNLQVGDVLVTDHPLNEPLRLILEHQLVTTADLGQLSSQKSIILRG
ncbi:MAG: FliM/FliN family flagellar motor C-terminal domain-containing protein, partial [bacterium]|nr:FliM/FliN family flagellar motor C-terminal domain-containing protein [bacterium]